MAVVISLNRWQIAIFTYLLIIGLLLIFKPAMMFTENGQIKTWGAETTETTSVFSPMIVFPLLGFLCYYMGVWLELVYF
jgi:hypothetical protein